VEQKYTPPPHGSQDDQASIDAISAEQEAHEAKLKAAEARIRELIEECFRSQPAYSARRWAEVEASRINGGQGLITPAPVYCVCGPCGISKTGISFEVLAVWLGAFPALRVAIAVPDHDLAREAISRLAALGVEAEHWLGRGALDPDKDDNSTMCPLNKYVDPLARRGCNIKAFFCDSCQIGHDGGCHYKNNGEKKPRVWVMTHQMLTSNVLGEGIDLLIIDESFGHVLRTPREVVLTVDELRAPPKRIHGEDFSTIINDGRAALENAIQAAPRGRISPRLFATPWIEEGTFSLDAEQLRLSRQRREFRLSKAEGIKLTHRGCPEEC
jgi:hypothetical protein